VCAQGGTAESSVWSFGGCVPATVRVRTVSGQALEETVASLPGTPDNPMPDAELLAKAPACLRAGARPLCRDAAARFAARFAAFENMADM